MCVWGEKTSKVAGLTWTTRATVHGFVIIVKCNMCLPAICINVRDLYLSFNYFPSLKPLPFLFHLRFSLCLCARHKVAWIHICKNAFASENALLYFFQGRLFAEAVGCWEDGVLSWTPSFSSSFSPPLFYALSPTPPITELTNLPVPPVSSRLTLCHPRLLWFKQTAEVKVEQEEVMEWKRGEWKREKDEREEEGGATWISNSCFWHVRATKQTYSNYSVSCLSVHWVFMGGYFSLLVVFCKDVN